MTLGTQGPEGGGQAPPLRLIASGYTLLAVVPHAAPENTCCAFLARRGNDERQACRSHAYAFPNCPHDPTEPPPNRAHDDHKLLLLRRLLSLDLCSCYCYWISNVGQKCSTLILGRISNSIHILLSRRCGGLSYFFTSEPPEFRNLWLNYLERMFYSLLRYLYMSSSRHQSILLRVRAAQGPCLIVLVQFPGAELIPKFK